MERTLIAFNLPNWITVLLMAAAGYAVLALASQFLLKPGGNRAVAAQGAY